MRSFIAAAALIAGASAQYGYGYSSSSSAVYYPSSSSTPVYYPSSSSMVEYPSSTPVYYPSSSSEVEYPSSTPVYYPSSSSEVVYPTYTSTPVYSTPVYETTVYTTYCPAPTQITHGGYTYTVTAPTTLVITYPVTTSVVTVCNSCYSSVYTPPASTYPPYPTGYTSVSSVYYPTASSAGPVYPTYTPPPSTGAASKAFAASGAGLAAVFGLAAFLL